MSNPPQLKKRPENSASRIGCGLLCLALVGLTLLCSGLISGVHFFSYPLPFVIATIMASLTAVPYFAFLWWLDRNEPEPFLLLFAAFLWGAFVATAISGLFNDAFSSAMMSMVQDADLAGQLSASLSAPFIEEITKGLALLVIFLLFIREFDNLLDGIIYGGMVGLGFAWFENILYYMKPFMEESGAWQDMMVIVYIRGLVSAAGGSHVTFTALTGFGFGMLRHKRNALWVYAMPFVGLAASMLAHFAWNSFAGIIANIVGMMADSETISLVVGLPIATLVVQGPFALFLLGAVWFAWGHEEKIILEHLKHEAEPVVTKEEYADLTPSLKRSIRSVRYFFVVGPTNWYKRHQIGRAQVELAFAKWHNHEDGEVDWPDHEDEIIVGLRKKIVGLKTNA